MAMLQVQVVHRVLRKNFVRYLLLRWNHPILLSSVIVIISCISTLLLVTKTLQQGNDYNRIDDNFHSYLITNSTSSPSSLLLERSTENISSVNSPSLSFLAINTSSISLLPRRTTTTSDSNSSLLLHSDQDIISKNESNTSDLHTTIENSTVDTSNHYFLTNSSFFQQLSEPPLSVNSSSLTFSFPNTSSVSSTQVPITTLTFNTSANSSLLLHDNRVTSIHQNETLPSGLQTTNEVSSFDNFDHDLMNYDSSLLQRPNDSLSFLQQVNDSSSVLQQVNGSSALLKQSIEPLLSLNSTFLSLSIINTSSTLSQQVTETTTIESINGNSNNLSFVLQDVQPEVTNISKNEIFTSDLQTTLSSLVLQSGSNSRNLTLYTDLQKTEFQDEVDGGNKLFNNEQPLQYNNTNNQQHNQSSQPQQQGEFLSDENVSRFPYLIGNDVSIGTRERRKNKFAYAFFVGEWDLDSSSENNTTSGTGYGGNTNNNQSMEYYRKSVFYNIIVSSFLLCHNHKQNNITANTSYSASNDIDVIIYIQINSNRTNLIPLDVLAVLDQMNIKYRYIATTNPNNIQGNEYWNPYYDRFRVLKLIQYDRIWVIDPKHVQFRSVVRNFKNITDLDQQFHLLFQFSTSGIMKQNILFGTSSTSSLRYLDDENNNTDSSNNVAIQTVDPYLFMVTPGKGKWENILRIIETHNSTVRLNDELSITPTPSSSEETRNTADTSHFVNVLYYYCMYSEGSVSFIFRNTPENVLSSSSLAEEDHNPIYLMNYWQNSLDNPESYTTVMNNNIPRGPILQEGKRSIIAMNDAIERLLLHLELNSPLATVNTTSQLHRDDYNTIRAICPSKNLLNGTINSLLTSKSCVYPFNQFLHKHNSQQETKLRQRGSETTNGDEKDVPTHNDYSDDWYFNVLTVVNQTHNLTINFKSLDVANENEAKNISEISLVSEVNWSSVNVVSNTTSDVSKVDRSSVVVVSNSTSDVSNVNRSSVVVASNSTSDVSNGNRSSVVLESNSTSDQRLISIQDTNVSSSKVDQSHVQNELYNTTQRSKFAYAYVIGGCHPEYPSYRNFIYNVAISTYLQRKDASTADVIVFIQLSYQTNYSILPTEDEQFLKAMNIKVNYLPKTSDESHYRITLDKFRILQLTDFDRVMFLDGDVLLYHNLDYLFHLSMDGTINANMIFQGKMEPANAGVFTLQPSEGDYEAIQEIIQKKESKEWDPVVGWGYALQDNDELMECKWGKNKKWDFVAAYADQGLLYYWVRFVKKSFSVINHRTIENWQPSLATNPNNITTQQMKSVLNVTLPITVVRDARLKTTNSDNCDVTYSRSIPCDNPVHDFNHFIGTKKPWIRGPLANFTARVREGVAYSRDDYWFYILSILNEQYQLNINFDNWQNSTKGGHRPTMGYFSKSIDATKKYHKNYNGNKTSKTDGVLSA